MEQKPPTPKDNFNVRILKNGPYLVSGKLPLKKDINVLLEEEIQTIINLTAHDLANNLISEYSEGSFDQPEMTNKISRSLKQMLNFVEKGGKFEFKPRVSDQDIAKSNKILNDSYALAIEIELISDRTFNSLVKDDQLTNKFGADILSESVV